MCVYIRVINPAHAGGRECIVDSAKTTAVMHTRVGDIWHKARNAIKCAFFSMPEARGSVPEFLCDVFELLWNSLITTKWNSLSVYREMLLCACLIKKLGIPDVILSRDIKLNKKPRFVIKILKLYICNSWWYTFFEKIFIMK